MRASSDREQHRYHSIPRAKCLTERSFNQKRLFESKENKGITEAEDDGVSQVNVLEVVLPVRVIVLELLHREDKVGDNEKKHDSVETLRIPDALKVRLEPQKPVLALELQAAFGG